MLMALKKSANEFWLLATEEDGEKEGGEVAKQITRPPCVL